jgi:hypothetical protein
MSSADADRSEIARHAANTRWRGQVISRAMDTLRSRSNELTAEQLADLRTIAEEAPDE